MTADQTDKAPKPKTKAAQVSGDRRYDVKVWPIARLKPYDRNARKHPESQIEELRASIRKFGQVWPILVRKDGTIIAGHGRLEAVQKEKFKRVRVIVADGWSETECREFGLLDNRVPLNSEWDKEFLRGELIDLAEAKVDLAELGFSTNELKRLGIGEAPGEPNTGPQLSGLSYAIVVRCNDETHQTQLLERLEGEGLTCEALIS